MKPTAPSPGKLVGIWIRVSTDMQVVSDSPEHHEGPRPHVCRNAGLEGRQGLQARRPLG